MNAKETARQLGEVNRQTNAYLDAARIHLPVQGEKLANRQNHLDNLKKLTGRWHGTFFDRGIPRSKKIVIVKERA